MWIFTKFGFYSVVCAKQGSGKLDAAIDTERVMVRARARDHLGRLINHFPTELGECEIMANVGTDYPFRIFVVKTTWARVVERLTQELDYGNFKSEVARYQGRAGLEYLDALHEVWRVMAGMGE